jgi:RNA polymerase sigma-70 factor, ECF subfamily
VSETTIGYQFDAGDAEERLLVQSLCAAEESAYETLIQRYERPVHNLVTRLTDDPGDALDIVQEVFLKVFRNIDRFRGDSSLKTWVYRIAVNEARNHRRWFGRHRKREVTMETVPGEDCNHARWMTDPGRSPLDLALDHEQRALIEEALGEVNPTFRAALVLREIEGMSYDEVSQVLEVSLGTVKSRIVRGREALRECLAKKMEEGTLAHANWSTKEAMAK